MIKLRQVSKKDCRLIWKWANDPDVRAVSFFSETIPYDNHVKWFQSKLGDPCCHFYIAENSNREPVGQVRFELKDNDATISIVLDRKYRGKGYGSRLIERASKKIFEVSNVVVIHAYIKESNTVSVGAFKKAGFVFIETTEICDQRASHLILKKEDLL